MKRPFKALAIGSKLSYNNKEYIKVETVYKPNNCCIPEYNAVSVIDNEKILIPSLTTVKDLT